MRKPPFETPRDTAMWEATVNLWGRNVYDFARERAIERGVRQIVRRTDRHETLGWLYIIQDTR